FRSSSRPFTIGSVPWRIGYNQLCTQRWQLILQKITKDHLTIVNGRLELRKHSRISIQQHQLPVEPTRTAREVHSWCTQENDTVRRSGEVGRKAGYSIS